MKIDTILKKIDSTPEYRLREIMGSKYIDTPGNYKNEKKYYNGIKDYMKSNMGESDYKKLIAYIKKNPTKIKLLFKRKK